MPRRLVIALAVCVVLTTFAALDPFHLRYSAPALAVLVGLGLLLATVLALRLLHGRGMRVVAVLLGTVAVLAWGGFVWFVAAFAGPERVIDEVVSEGTARLVVVEGRAFTDAVYSVRLRAGSGPLAQESLVWQGLAEGAPPGEVRFTGPEQVEVLAAGGCGYRASFDATTLDVEPVFRPLRLDGC
jgi:hypothetical protein